mmetsp:Transcript_8894/g.32797  ORF Transcript_8894/g.32797 Transcript_8894/m.32797 type:complete len:104 (+) Transcript_8894:686-997(+)
MPILYITVYCCTLVLLGSSRCIVQFPPLLSYNAFIGHVGPYLSRPMCASLPKGSQRILLRHVRALDYHALEVSHARALDEPLAVEVSPILDHTFNVDVGKYVL